jgi:nucleotide-binding universal stress UspA family protein
MKRILVPVDFSPTSKKAFKYALDIASRSGGSVLLYHLYTAAKKSTPGLLVSAEEYNRQLALTCLKKLKRLKKEIMKDDSDVSVSTIIGRSPVVSNILKYSEKHHIDLIVMGTQGARGLKRITMGSNASKVMEQTNIPVLLIPEKFQWKLPENIVFTTAFKRTDRNALSVAFEFIRLYGAVVTFVNLAKPDQQNYSDEGENFETYAFSLQREYSGSKIKFRQLKTKSIMNTMEILHQEIPYDMLIMARRELSFLDRFFQKSFTKEMACITTQPLLVIPQK